MLIWIPFVVCLAGLILYGLSKDSKIQVIARDCFWVGLLVFLLRWAGSIAVR